MSVSKSPSAGPGNGGRRQAEKAQRHSERRLTIKRCAKELLITHGIDKFTVSEVAQALHLSKPALYYYYRSKEALVYDLAIEALELEINAIAPQMRAAERGVAALVNLVKARVDYYLNDVDSFRILYVWVPALGMQRQVSVSEPSQRMNAMLGSVAGRLAAECRTNGKMAGYDVQQLPHMAWALSQGILCQGIASAMSAKDREDCRALRDVACRWLLDSLID